MRISLVVAVDRQGGIGRAGQMPWHLPADLAYFRRVTLDKPIIMGRRTYQAIGRPLPQRHNIIISHDKNLRIEGAVVVDSPAAALAEAADASEVLVIGGTTIYEAFLPQADRLYITEVLGNFECDTYFPPIDLGQWEEIRRIEQPADARNPYAMAFVVLDRRRESSR